MNQTPTNSAAPAASPDSEWLDPSAMRAIANRPEQRTSEFLDCAPRVQAMAREILRLQQTGLQGSVNDFVRPILMGPVMALERILNALGIKTESLHGLEPIDWIRLCAKRVGKDAQNRVAEIATQKESKEWFNEALPDFEAMHRELFGKVNPDEPRVTQTAARVLREQREELDEVDRLLNIGEVPRGMRIDRIRTVIADRNGRRQQLVEAHDALDKAGCPVPRFDAPNGARLADRIAAIVKQRDRAQRKAGVPVLRLRNRFGADFSRMKDGDVIVTDTGAHVLRKVDGQMAWKPVMDARPRGNCAPPYREHTPSSLIVNQAHQRLVDHGVPKVATGGARDVAPLLGLVEMTLVERITWLADTAQRNHSGPKLDDVEKLRAENCRLNDYVEHLHHCATRGMNDEGAEIQFDTPEQAWHARNEKRKAKLAEIASLRRLAEEGGVVLAELADARAKLVAIQKFANPGMRADGKSKETPETKPNG